MQNPGTYTLVALPLTAALASHELSAIEGLDGIQAATLEARFGYGSGGTSCAVVAQVTIDGTNWLDVARFDFAQASAVKVTNLNGQLSKAVTAYLALAAEGVNDGVLGPSWRGVVTSVGVYANTTVSLRLVAR